MSDFTETTSTNAATASVVKRVFCIIYGKDHLYNVAAEFIQYNGSTIILKNRNDHVVAVLTEGYGVIEEGNIIN